MKPFRRLSIGSVLFLVVTALVIVGLVILLPRMLA